jgi:hypothetical protein
MSLATFAYVLAVMELLVGIPLLIAPVKTITWMKKLLHEDVTLRVFSALLVIMGALVLIEDSTIGTDVPGLLRLLAWLIVVKHVIMCWWPGHMRKMADKFLKNTGLVPFIGLAAVIIGVLLILAGNSLS